MLQSVFRALAHSISTLRAWFFIPSAVATLAAMNGVNLVVPAGAWAAIAFLAATWAIVSTQWKLDRAVEALPSEPDLSFEEVLERATGSREIVLQSDGGAGLSVVTDTLNRIRECASLGVLTVAGRRFDWSSSGLLKPLERIERAHWTNYRIPIERLLMSEGVRTENLSDEVGFEELRFWKSEVRRAWPKKAKARTR